tara:strand:- start:5412 stop:5651 length:240 start_codon:yes stop_codon:yes gene_type:complete
MIYEIIGIACIGAILQSFEGYQVLLSKLYLDIKPFNCALCMTFWMTIIPNIAVYGLKGIYISSIEAVLAELIDRKLMTL